MKVFVSSVRRGLEAERDALPGLLTALGHTPSSFEKFTAQPMPSREACLRGVGEADVYLLLLGEHYGQTWSDTQRSATEEEYQEAVRRGIPRLAFRKNGVTPEPEQAVFIGRVEEYASGLFRNSFDDVADLLTKVVAALGALSAPASLTWTPLAANWEPASWTPQQATFGYQSVPTLLGLHAESAGSQARMTVTELETSVDRLVRVGRDLSLFASTDAVTPETDGSTITVRTTPGHRSPNLAAALRVTRDATASAWQQVPSDSLGTILDRDDLIARTAILLNALAAIIHPAERVAIAVSLDPVHLPTVGSATDIGRRSSASLGTFNVQAIHVPAEDSVPVTALGDARQEVAREVTARLLHAFRNPPGREGWPK